jgi:hypothetical protein
MQNKLLLSKESLFFLLITIFLSYYISPFFLNPQYDRQVFIYGSMTIIKGGVPYKDFFDHKPPLIYLILTIGWQLKWWGIWLIGVISKWIAAIFIYKAALKYDIALKLLPSLGFLIFLLDPFLICMGSFTREYSTVFMVIAFSIMLQNPGKKYVQTGFTLGLVFFTQQEEILALAPFTFWHLCTHQDESSKLTWRLFSLRVLQMFLGFLIIALPLLTWLYSKNALSEFWEQAFLFNLYSYPPNSDFGERIMKSFALLYHTRVGFFIVIFIFLHLFAFYKSKRRSLHFIPFLTILLFSIYKIIYTRLGENSDAQHYLLGFAAIFAISIVLLQKELTLYLQKTTWKITVVTVFFLSSWFLWENALTSKYTVKVEENYTRSQQILPLLTQIRNQDGQLYVFRNTSLLFLHNELNVLSPSKWIFTTMYDQHLKFDPEHKLIKEIINDLEKKKTRYIVDMSGHDPLNITEMQQQWDAYVAQHYKVITDAGEYKVLERIR